LITLLHVARRGAAIAWLCLAVPAFAQDAAPPKPLRAATLNDLYSDETLVDARISPSGRYVAAVVRREKDDVLVVFDLVANDRKVIQRVGFDEAGKALILYMVSIRWKSDDTLLLRLRVRPEDALNFYTVSSSRLAKLGDRLFALERSTGKAIALLGDNRNAALEGAFNLGEVRSLLSSSAASARCSSRSHGPRLR
jgi:hypothetical protein